MFSEIVDAYLDNRTNGTEIARAYLVLTYFSTLLLTKIVVAYLVIMMVPKMADVHLVITKVLKELMPIFCSAITRYQITLKMGT